MKYNKLSDFFINNDTNNNFILAMAPGFFRKYVYVGILDAIEELMTSKKFKKHLKGVCGSSAGAICSSFLAKGYLPSEMAHELLDLKREDFWKFQLFGFGVLSSERLINLFQEKLPGKDHFDDCNIPISVSAYDVYNLKMIKFDSGKLCEKIAASCCVPLMFHPVMIKEEDIEQEKEDKKDKEDTEENISSSSFIKTRPFVDAGFEDIAGMFALPSGIKNIKLIVNLMCDRDSLQYATIDTNEFPEYENVIHLKVVMEGIPHVSPFNMATGGREAYEISKNLMKQVLLMENPCIIEEYPSSYIVIITNDPSLSLP